MNNLNKIKNQNINKEKVYLLLKNLNLKNLEKINELENKVL
jgi:hypothetical protein